MNKVVIFDFFGVFCPDITLEWFKKSVPDYDDKLAAFHAICKMSDYGTLSRNAFNTQVSELTNIPVEQLISGVEAETVINESLVEYTKNLRNKGYRTACLSNGTHEWTLRVIEDHGLRDLFDEIVLSGDVGIVKPDLRIYETVLAKMNISSPEAVFIDDRQVNVDAAEALGIHSFLFADTAAFIKEFELYVGKSG